jgi:hypothetical protein
VTHDHHFFFQLNTCGHSPYVRSSLTRGCVCRLQLLISFASAVILRFESRGTHDHILLSQTRDSRNLEGQFPVFIAPRNRVAQIRPQILGSLSSLPTTHGAMVEISDPTSTRGLALTNFRTRLRYNISARTTQKTPSLCCC